MASCHGGRCGPRRRRRTGCQVHAAATVASHRPSLIAKQLKVLLLWSFAAIAAPASIPSQEDTHKARVPLPTWFCKSRLLPDWNHVEGWNSEKEERALPGQPQGVLELLHHKLADRLDHQRFDAESCADYPEPHIQSLKDMRSSGVVMYEPVHLRGGFNNQRQAMALALTIAYALNRTLVRKFTVEYS